MTTICTATRLRRIPSSRFRNRHTVRFQLVLNVLPDPVEEPLLVPFLIRDTFADVGELLECNIR